MSIRPVTKPIKPSEVAQHKKSYIPEKVIDSFNFLIAKHWEGKSARFTVDEIIDEILKRDPTTPRDEIFRRKWLDVETIYREQGWRVEYDQPAYCESYPAKFTFTEK